MVTWKLDIIQLFKHFTFEDNCTLIHNTHNHRDELVWQVSLRYFSRMRKTFRPQSKGFDWEIYTKN